MIAHDFNPSAVINQALDSMAIGTMEFYGHSGTYGGASLPIRGIDERVAAAFHADEYNETHGGAILSRNEQTPYSTIGNGGWAHVYRQTNVGASVAPYSAKRDFVSLFFGLNDVPVLGPSASDQKPLTNAYHAIISRVRAAAVFEENHASVTFPTGTWTRWTNPTSGSSQWYASSGSYETAASGKVRVTVPSDFPGGTVALAFLSGINGDGALWDLTVDGVGAGQLETRNVNAKDYISGAEQNVTPVVKRFTGLAPGTHTIEATINTVQNNGFFDCWWIESAVPPMVLVPLFWKPQSYAPTYNTWPYGVVNGLNDADRVTLNARIQAVVDGYGEPDNVFTVQTDDVIQGTATPELFYDNLHLNDLGHAIVAEKIVKAIQGKRRPLSEQVSGDVLPPFIGSKPHDSARNVIEARHPDITPLTIRGRKEGDQFNPLLSLVGADLAAALTYFYLDRADSAHDLQFAVAAGGSQYVTGSAAGDAILKNFNSTKAFRFVIGTTQRLIINSDGRLSSVADGTAQTDATTVGQARKGMFSAYRHAALTLVKNTDTPLAADTEDVDFSNWFDTTNGRYTPQAAGWYRLTASATINSLATGKIAYVALYKNGTLLKYGPVSTSGAAANVGVIGNWIVQANGSTDYFDVRVFHNDTVDRNAGVDTTNRFDGSLIGLT